MQQLIGQWLGSYQIMEQIGQGGMATVFKAYQPSMDRYVAIKVLPGHFAEDASFVERFNREARTLARLEHPHILPVHDYGEHEGITYLVMRYIGDGTLRDLIGREGPMEPREAERILGQVGRALDYAHSQGVVHRDIKPSNVLIDQRNNTFLADFGIAKLIAETAQFTASGAIIGTPAYMSPEQAMGTPADYHSDIYSLGVLLYEMVTGRVPFQAETPLAVLLKHVNDPLPLPRQVKPGLPEGVERVILKAMAKAPGDRFQSAGAMVDALAKAVAAMPTEISSPPPRGGLADATTWVEDTGAPPPPAVSTAPPPLPAKTSPGGLAALTWAIGQRPWLWLVGGVVLLGLLLVAGLGIVRRLTDSGVAPAVAGQVEPTVNMEGQVTVSATVETVGEAAATPTAEMSGQLTSTPVVDTLLVRIIPTVVDEPVPPTPARVPERAPYPAGWTNYSNSSFVYALARRDNTLWAGGEGGLLRWDLTDGSYTRLGRSDGLASNRINDLLVDEEGDLWIATDSGICRDDGQTILTYDEVDGLDTSWIQTLFLDSEGGLWAGSRGGEVGLNYFDGISWGPPPVPPLPVEGPIVTALAADEEWGLFVGMAGQGLAYYDFEEWSLLTSADGLPSDEVLDLLLTPSELWVSCDVGILWIDLMSGDSETIAQGNIRTMAQTADGKIWFGGESRAIRYDTYTEDWQEFETAPGPIPGWAVNDVLEDEDGLWFATSGGGTAFFDGGGWEAWAVDEELGGNEIEAVRQDRDGVMWFTHPGTGMTRYDPRSDAWQVFGDAEGAEDWPSVPGVDSEGNLWIGTYGELVRYDGQGWQRFTSPELADVEVYGIEIGPGDVQWLVTDSGLLRHDPSTEEWSTFTSVDHPIIADIWSILAASDGVLWLGGEEELVQYDGNTWSTSVTAGEAPRMVEDLAEAPDGSLWMVTDGQLGHLDGGRCSYFAWPGGGWVEAVAVAPDGSVWAGYEGVGRYDPSGGGWQVFRTDDGLVDMTVNGIQVTPRGVVWIGTNGGVSRYVPTR